MESAPAEDWLDIGNISSWQERRGRDWTPPFLQGLNPLWTWGSAGLRAGLRGFPKASIPGFLVCSPVPGQGWHLEDALVVDLVEDGAVDLVGLQRHPVEHGHAELGLDGLLDLHSWGQHMENP